MIFDTGYVNKMLNKGLCFLFLISGREGLLDIDNILLFCTISNVNRYTIIKICHVIC
jgi:hypothetical protein